MPSRPEGCPVLAGHPFFVRYAAGSDVEARPEHPRYNGFD